MSNISIAAVALCLLGCGASASTPPSAEVRATASNSSSTSESSVAVPAPPSEEGAGPGEAAECWWIWTASDGAPTSRRVCDEGGELRVTETEPGIHVVVGGEDASLVVGEVSASRTRCGEEDEEVIDPTVVLVGHRLDVVRTRDTISLLEAPSMRGMEEFEDRIEVLATIGPYAAVRRFTHSYSACGAEAYEVTEEHWLNMDTSEELPMPVPTDAERDAALLALVRPALANAAIRAELLAYLEEESGDWSTDRAPTDAEVATFLEDGPGTVALGGLVPRLHAGRWLAHRVARYAIDENADSFEVVLHHGELPAMLAQHADVPEVIQRILPVGPGGWSTAR